MKSVSPILLVALAVFTPLAQAQFGSGIVYDPTQSAHAVHQILQANQLYTTTVQTERNVIAAYNLARWLMRDGEAAEDVLQEAMVRALTYFASFKGVNPRAWLLQIVRNTAYTWLSRNRSADS